MLNIDSYMQNLLHLLQIHFPRRIIYLGLQGSYARGEATANSDIDVFLVLDQLSVVDLKRYKNLLAAMDCPAQSCGFICGVQELAGIPVKYVSCFMRLRIITETWPQYCRHILSRIWLNISSVKWAIYIIISATYISMIVAAAPERICTKLIKLLFMFCRINIIYSKIYLS